MISFELEGLPPSSNHAYETVYVLVRGKRRASRRLSKEGSTYERGVTAQIADQIARMPGFSSPEAKYGVLIRLYFDTLNKGFPKTAKGRYKGSDASNRVKLLEDAIKKAVGRDDSHNFFVGILKEHSPEVEYTLVELWRMDQERRTLEL